ncbi:MAG TPA: VOC family protein [Vitreimonas sp.]|uniref:bleomycin resistance protein n=1 Tax=Vitreimonas sp. TaxID=3069702 RepID=UPI002D2CB0A6|nr:VOC family protein [Vitreimonas sp.]HYD85893.1 VOC family protein [Vitreimonas sp.]
MSATLQIRDATPVLLVRDVVKAAAYYTDKLGFNVERFWGDPPMFTIARRDGVSVMLNQVDAGDSFRPNDYDGRFSLYLDVSDADALHAEFAAQGADIVCAPEDQPYFMREFQVRDLDGHLLGVGHDISGKN